MSDRILRLLKEQGRAAVLYPHPVSPGEIIHIDGKMRVRVRECRPATFRHLEELVPLSGFRDADAWVVEEFRSWGYVPRWVAVLEPGGEVRGE